MIRLSKSCIGEAEKAAVREVLDREFLGMGQEVQQFENRLADFFGRDAICVSTGTAALHLACQAIGLKPGDEVLIQSLTYIASYQAISATGAIPVSCDIYPESFTIDLNDAIRKLTPKTKAIMPVHYSGGVGNLNEVFAIAKKNNLRVIEDASHAFGTVYKGRKIGSFGDITCFSFDGIKNITSGEGGCVVSSDQKLLNTIKDLRLLGVQKDTENRYQGKRSWLFDVQEQGWRYHMSNIMAAIGLEQLKRFDELKSKRQEWARFYQSRLSSINSIKILNLDYNEVVPHIFVIILNNHERNKVQAILHDKGIQTGIHYQPNHWLSYYQKDRVKLPVTEDIFPRIFSIPLHPDLSREDIEYVCVALSEIL
jgi:dTDP-4-amino-4,6-dideoxygalactose transaminase